MSSRRSIEITGENVEDAISKGLAELGVGPSEVIVEVLDEPSRGVFGIGARPARVRLQLLSTPKPATPPPAPVIAAPPPPPPVPVTPPPAPAKPVAAVPKEAPPEVPDPDSYLDIEVEDEDEGESLFRESDEVIAEEGLDEEAAVGKVVLGELLERMQVRNIRVVVRRGRATRPSEAVPYILDVEGSDLTRLIGRRGETLAALQYITRLIASREMQRRVNLIVDVGGYKARRAQMLRSLALRMADQSVERGRTVTLEPMPPYERRIIHLVLRDREDVVTKSVGEGNARKVTIIPKTQSS